MHNAKQRLYDKGQDGRVRTENKASCLHCQMGTFAVVRRPSWPDSTGATAISVPGETGLSHHVQVVEEGGNAQGQLPASKPGRGN